VACPKPKKPKRHCTAAAHSINMSRSDAIGDHCSWIFLNIAVVMGNLILAEESVYTCMSWIPDYTKRRWGSGETAFGSGSPNIICIWQIPARYVFIVCRDEDWHAR